jgi:S-disulfanyl-L-cysteine oxidoreductase SoxD
MGASTMRLLRLLLIVMIVALCPPAWAQAPDYGLGRTPSAAEIRAWDISISPTGKGLPPGRGTAKEGAEIFAQKCAACHGSNGAGGLAPTLIKVKGMPVTTSPTMQMGQGPLMATYSPYATTIWDYINRGMPLGHEGTLKPDEVYALTAFLLYKNGIIQQDDVMDAQSLPKVKMPNRDGYAPLPEYKHGAPREFTNAPEH